MARPSDTERGARIARSTAADILAPDLFPHPPAYLREIRTAHDIAVETLAECEWGRTVLAGEGDAQ